jgi:16S rRNA (cytosine967-C5)-methyltransferase
VTQPLSKELWQLLQAVAKALHQQRQGVSGTVVMQSVAAPLRPAVQSLLFQVWRQLGRAECLRDVLVKRRPAPLPDALLCAALALIWDESLAPYEPFTLVNQAVEAAKRDRGMAAQSSFINACLRRFLREKEALVKQTSHNELALWNHPKWWVARLRKDHPQHWQAILQANQQAAPMSLRVNVKKISRDDLLARWQKAGIEATQVGESGLTLQKALPVHQIPGFDEGECSVQDPAAQYAANALLQGLPATKMRVLDACAAPGGKTAHLLELLSPDSEVVALEVDSQRCTRIEETLARLGLKAQIQVADAAKPKMWWDGKAFDAILLDAPCSASGIVRRHPDVRWLRRDSDILQLAGLQQRILQALWPLLKPQGRLLYCTCSVFKAEGEDQIKAFLARNTDAQRLPSVGHLLPQNGNSEPLVNDNLPGDHDGFYYALLQKK